MLFRVFFLLCISFALIVPSVSAATFTEESASLRKVLRIDRTIRTSTGDTQREKKNRARLLIATSANIETIWNTWNLIPTTDKTLSYKLSLQQYALSCEIAAMRTIFAALGYPRTEDQIIRTLPHHNKPMDQERGTWGDPDQEFVGLYTGSQNKKTGYGIYEGAIARYFHSELGGKEPTLRTEAWNELTRPIEETDQTHLTHLLESIDTGKHVILWGDWCTAGEFEDGVIAKNHTLLTQIFPLPARNPCQNYKAYRYYDWRTSTGKKVTALSGDHVFVLLGYIGKREHPTHIIVWDTDTGRHVYPISEWMRKWGLMQYRSLVVSN